MRRLFFISFVSILFITFSCKKVEENPTYKIELQKNQVFKKNRSQVWRDTIFYSISGTTEENYRFVLTQASESYALEDYHSYSRSQYVTIVQQTPNYLIYEVDPSNSSSYYSSSEYSYVYLFLVANGEVIDNVDLSIKFVTSSSNNTNGTDDGWLIYKSGSSIIKKYDFATSLSSTVYSSSSTIYDLKISPDAQNLAYSSYSTIYYRTITGGYINSHSAYPDAIGFTPSNDLFYIDGNYHYQYTNIANSTSKNNTYIYGLRDFVSAPNSYYYNINYSSYYYTIYRGNSTSLYTSSNILTDITIDDQNTTLLFVEDDTKLKKLDLNTNSVTTLYSVSSSSEIKNPDFNEDGTKIAFVIENYNGYGDIYTMSTNGSNVVNLSLIHI